MAVATSRGRVPAHGAGFTLLELLVTISVVAILATVAVPSFRNVLMNSARTEAVNDFVAALTRARSEAQAQSRSVVVCPLNTAGNCSPGAANWQNGWLVYVNMDATSPPALDNNDRVVLRHHRARTSPTINNNSVAQLVFRPFPGANTNATFTFCDNRGSSEARKVVIGLNGRIRTEEGGTCP